MFHFFFKRSYLADFLEDAIDIHCHLLPGIDDGSPSSGVSERMIALYKKLGFRKAITTAHIMESYYDNSPATIAGAYRELINDMPEAKEFIFHNAAEYMIDGNFISLLQEKENLLCLKDRKILVELSYFQKPIQLEDTIFQLMHQNYIPVLAHPERYNYITDISEYKDLKRRGCLFQINMLSLSTHYGNEVQKKGELLLKEGLIDFIGSDAHRLEHLEKIKNLSLSNKISGKISLIIRNTREHFSG